MKKGYTIIEWLLLTGLACFILVSIFPRLPALALEVKQSTAFVDKAVLLNDSNQSQAITGLTNATTTLYYAKATGAAAQATVFTLTELDSTNMKGGYNVTFNASVMDTVGPFVYWLMNGTVATYRGKFDIVANLESDTYAKANAANDTVNSATIGNSVIKASQNNLTNVTLAATQTGVTIPTVTTLTTWDKTGYALTSAYDPAKTAAQAGDIMKVSSGTGANQISLSSGLVTVGTNNDKTGYTASTVSDKTGYSLSTAPPTSAQIVAAMDANSTMLGNISANTTAIFTDTDAMDTANELRTLLTGGTSALSTLTASDNIGINWGDITNPTATQNLSGTSIAPVSVNTTAVWSEDVSGYTTAGQAGTYLKGAASAGDPWSTDLSSGYDGQAGEMLRKTYKNTKMIR